MYNSKLLVVIVANICLIIQTFNSCNAQQLSDLVQKYYNEQLLPQKTKISKTILKTGPSFDELYGQLKMGKNYDAQQVGIINVAQQGATLPPIAVAIVPEDYNPKLKYPLLVYLHGAVTNNDPYFLFRYTIDTLNAELLKTKSVLIFPSGWSLAPWWSKPQVENINQLIRWAKFNYNIDENHISLRGVSDGSIGCYYMLNCDQTYWSAVNPFIGSIRALTNVGDRPTHLNNFINPYLFIVNTSLDHIFEITWEKPYVDQLLKLNDRTTYIQVDTSGHSLRWFPLLKDSIDKFNQSNRRETFPDELIWQTENVEDFGRYKYLIIEKLGKTKSIGNVKDQNSVQLRSQLIQAFDHKDPFGIVSLKKEKNIVRVETSGVRQYKLLLSPEHFDFSLPVSIYTNDTKSFEEIVEPNIETLLKWNTIDNDREMLFGAEVTIKVN